MYPLPGALHPCLVKTLKTSDVVLVHPPVEDRCIIQKGSHDVPKSLRDFCYLRYFILTFWN